MKLIKHSISYIFTFVKVLIDIHAINTTYYYKNIAIVNYRNSIKQLFQGVNALYIFLSLTIKLEVILTIIVSVMLNSIIIYYKWKLLFQLTKLK